MIITESFVFLHYPKAGGTFVRDSLFELYNKIGGTKLNSGKIADLEVIMTPELRLKSVSKRRGVPTEHGTLSQVPKCHGDLPVFSVWREITDRALSNYYYQDWKNNDVLLGPRTEIYSSFPNFPELSVKDFFRYIDKFLSDSIQVGEHQIAVSPWASDFLKFFSKRPIDADNVNFFTDWKDFNQNLGDVNFLRQENLAEDLCGFLVDCGHSPDDVEFIKQKPRVNKSSRSGEQEEDFSIAKEFLENDYLLDALIERAVHKKKVDFGFLYSSY